MSDDEKADDIIETIRFAQRRANSTGRAIAVVSHHGGEPRTMPLKRAENYDLEPLEVVHPVRPNPIGSE